ncbi:type II toxin-antitoxin system ParD family antitoxin [Mesorhizobium sp. RMAD-H1]|uniref:type II toxin-antitoxin system ParD family antitoxin n=1 Tax=Mesorhizobium sp. RMAD-H1 TaxID=2587065 RepID=UPI001614E573|nr:type II toxin-antitoxin system ParD family antitoxin [Mesorhizobium sp. RMAD-H1]MBB2972070.1 antitoxin ParD1/3/4 [Mesorhizobium sp. RMAD-H1]
MAISADLGKPLEDYVEELVKSGRYRSRSEVLREGIRLVQERELKLEVFKREVQKGIDAADRGELDDADLVFDELLQRYAD